MNKYVKNRSAFSSGRPTSSKAGKKIIWLYLLLFFVAVTIIVVMILTGGSKNDDQELPENEGTTVEEMEDAIEELEIAEIEEVSNLESIELMSLVGAEYGGTARRGTENDVFTHVVVATLPQIDHATHFYEGWLVKPGVTEFFSTGEMFPRQDGKYGLVWEVSTFDARSDLDEFTQVVITREVRGGGPEPEVHVLEGDF